MLLGILARVTDSLELVRVKQGGDEAASFAPPHPPTRYKMSVAPREGHSMEQERRGAPRFSFIASAEVLAETVGPRMSSRISDLSLSGCYVDTINPLNNGTLVHVKIFTDTQVFEASATVAFSHTHLGMGLAFKDVQPKFRQVLQGWLPAAV
jgi:hypothetical protein